VLAAGAAAPSGPGVAGAAAGKVFDEVDALSRSRGGRPETFAGLAGVGDLVASVLADGSAHRRAGELLAQGVPAAELAHAVRQSVDAIDYLPMLASAARDARVKTPALDGLAALVQGQIQPEQWTATVTEPIVGKRSRPIRAA
jgi:glycerol-3-phosphate dehydrogenase